MARSRAYARLQTLACAILVRGPDSSRTLRDAAFPAMAGLTLDGLGVLVIDDEPLIRKQVAAALGGLGASVDVADCLAAGRSALGSKSYDFLILDLNLPDGLGLDLLEERGGSGAMATVVLTAGGGVDTVVRAMRLGAVDYLAKPFDAEQLPLVIARARRARQGARIREHERDESEGSAQPFFFGASLQGLQTTLAKILAADRRMEESLPPVLIEGETGAGKTTIARWIHRHGPRATGPLIEVNCSSLPEALAESELFGHEKGAFTDAKAARMGLFEAAHGGTLFLDELPSLSPGLQAKLLTAIEDRSVRRLGGNRPVAVDVRLVAASNRDLRSLVAEGRFREDLHHRLDLYRLLIPPLRTRGEDIVRLAELVLEQVCRRHRLPLRRFSETAVSRLLAHRWPGNVRELAHEIERAVVFEEDECLHLEGLSFLAPAPAPAPAAGSSTSNWLVPGHRFPESGFSLEAAIRVLIDRAVEQAGGNISGAARLLGVSRDYLRYRLSK